MGAVTADDVAAARPAVEAIARHTPVLSSRTISERTGGVVMLKAENLQRTGSFKIRGAAAKLAALGEGCSAGVVAASAGNHAQSLAAAARARGVPCEVFVPDDAPLAKVEAARGQGAIVHSGGDSVDACLSVAQEHARAAGMAFVHPFDDPHIVAGQGSLGLELLDDVPDLAKVIVPVGGGGLCSGVAIAVKAARPDVEVIGVQVAACAPYPESLRRGEPVAATSALTIADGIAVKRPGDLTLPLLAEHADGIVLVDEDETAAAMVVLMERCKLVVEGAGAVGVAALLGGQVRPAETGTTVAVLSGGNVDPGLLAAVARRAESEAGRRLVLLTRVADRPGGLAHLLVCVADTGANIVDVSHVREGLDLHVRETAIELVLETRGHDHAADVVKAMRESGYEAQVLY
ncbi:MAG TPA: threonine ammonia-lyase [Solirubrobacteraceae bacterium]|nr:threonine ammonia-lyase [Solirubrobacteraceae bacterium]